MLTCAAARGRARRGGGVSDVAAAAWPPLAAAWLRPAGGPAAAESPPPLRPTEQQHSVHQGAPQGRRPPESTPAHRPPTAPPAAHLPQRELVVVLVVQHVEQVAVEGVHVVDLGELLQHRAQLVVPAALRVLDLAHVKLADALDRPACAGGVRGSFGLLVLLGCRSGPRPQAARAPSSGQPAPGAGHGRHAWAPPPLPPPLPRACRSSAAAACPQKTEYASTHHCGRRWGSGAESWRAQCPQSPWPWAPARWT